MILAVVLAVVLAMVLAVFLAVFLAAFLLVLLSAFRSRARRYCAGRPRKTWPSPRTDEGPGGVAEEPLRLVVPQEGAGAAAVAGVAGAGLRLPGGSDPGRQSGGARLSQGDSSTARGATHFVCTGAGPRVHVGRLIFQREKKAAPNN